MSFEQTYSLPSSLVGGRCLNFGRQVLSKLAKFFLEELKEISDAEQKMNKSLLERGLIPHLFGVITLQIAFLAMTIATKDHLVVTKLASFEMMQFEAGRIVFATDDAAWRVCSETFQSRLTAAFFPEKIIVHIRCSFFR